ncbi:MAG: hypothetical protein V4686_03675 [Patescibacteria group bacterium]
MKESLPESPIYRKPPTVPHGFVPIKKVVMPLKKVSIPLHMMFLTGLILSLLWGGWIARYVDHSPVTDPTVITMFMLAGFMPAIVFIVFLLMNLFGAFKGRK